MDKGGFDEAPQANYGTAATVPALDPELAKQLGFTTEEVDAILAPNKISLSGDPAAVAASVVSETKAAKHWVDGYLDATDHDINQPEI